MRNNHMPGHMYALVKNKICTTVLSFPEHDEIKIVDTISKMDYDVFIDLCSNKINANIGDSWNGSEFKPKPYESWTLDNDGNWKAPVEQEDPNHIWYEEYQLWADPFVTDKEDSTNPNRQ